MLNENISIIKLLVLMLITCKSLYCADSWSCSGLCGMEIAGTHSVANQMKFVMGSGPTAEAAYKASTEKCKEVVPLSQTMVLMKKICPKGQPNCLHHELVPIAEACVKN